MLRDASGCFTFKRNHEHPSKMTASTYQALDSPPLSPHAAGQPNPVSTGSEQQPHPSRTTSATRINETPKLQSDSTSDKATAAFVRRTLCSHNVLLGNGEKGRTTPRPIEEVLPPLTSSNDIDLQLYGIISVIIKEFVQTWYTKITPDHVFVNEVLQIIAHCTRGLEQRLRKVDLEALLMDELPELLEIHISCRCVRTLGLLWHLSNFTYPSYPPSEAASLFFTCIGLGLSSHLSHSSPAPCTEPCSDRFCAVNYR